MHCPTLDQLPLPPTGKTGWPWTEQGPQLPSTMSDGSPWPRVSIVTPSYNQGQFIEETIRSVLLQGYPNLEYLVMDGGSTDDSVALIRQYASWLTYWTSEEDRGQSDAVNKGWRRATGEILAYLNSDDGLMPGALQAVAQAFRENAAAGIIHGDWVYVDSGGRKLRHRRGQACDLGKLLNDGQIVYAAQPASFFDATLTRQVGYLDDTLHLSMDYDLFLKLARISEMVYVPLTLAFFRLHGGAKSAEYIEQHWQESFRVLARHGGRYLLKPRLRYIRYRLFRIIPRSLRAWVRRRRNLARDWVYLQERIE